MAEAGVSGYEVLEWNPILGPAGMAADVKAGFKIPPDYNPHTELFKGKSLWPPPYGEVYEGIRWLVDEDPTPADDDGSFECRYCNLSRSGEKVAVKRIAHLNVHCIALAHLETKFYHAERGHVITLTPHRHSNGSFRLPLTTTQLLPYYETSGRNENVAQEVEMMRYIDSLIESDPEAALLRGMFLKLIEFGICGSNLYVVTPLRPIGSLFTSKRPYMTVGESASKHLSRHLLRAVSFLHRHLIAHRDISIENVVLDAAIDQIDDVLLYLRRHRFLSVEHYENLSVVLIDPGQAVRHARKIPTPAAGPDYEYLVLDRHPPGKSMVMCPEHYRAAPYLQFEERLHYCGMQVDMWQAGVLLFYLVTGRAPYEVQTSVYLELQGQAEWMRCIADQDLGNWTLAAPLGSGGANPAGGQPQAVRDLVSPECLELLEQMLHPEQARRVTADAALTHRWYTGAQL